MRRVSPATTIAWRSEVKAGERRPVVRATSQRIFLGREPYNTADAPGGDYDKERQRTGFYRSILFGRGGSPREIPNLRRCEWSRSIDQDVATCTLTVANTQLVPIGADPADHNADDFEQRGYLAYRRGLDPEAAARWGYDSTNIYTNRIMPDRLVRTFEGYGANYDAAPGDDENLYISGTWLIDEVRYDANGDISIVMRDVGRLLLDHISFPPIVPYAEYPMKWVKIKNREVQVKVPTGGGWAKPGASTTSSNDLYKLSNIIDQPPYVRQDGSIQGHSDRAPLTPATDDYWLSTGQASREGYVWWEETFKKPHNISAVRVHTFGGPYKVYVSVHTEENGWEGRREIPYRFGSIDGYEDEIDTGEALVGSVDAEADIPFVATDVAERDAAFDIDLRRTYRRVTKVRITLTRLRQMSGKNYPYRGGLRDVQVYRAANANDLGRGNQTVVKSIGNYSDFTDIIRWVCSWTGWWWPQAHDRNWINFRTSNDPDDRTHYPYANRDRALVKGRVWGSLQQTGTAGVADLTADQFDKQPLMTAIQKVREIVGFQFMIDESGGVVWRRANIWSPGNYITRDHKQNRTNPEYVQEWLTLSDDLDLLSYQTRLSSRNLRERIFVGSTNGKVGAVVRGYRPLPHTGLRRVAGWLDENWKRKKEAIVAADLIAARQMFDYRRSRWTIHGNPALQIDDQVRIFERTTNETFYHYVSGISSVLDNEQGTWEYAVESHWLGPDIDQAFIQDAEVMHPATKKYMQAIGGEN